MSIIDLIVKNKALILVILTILGIVYYLNKSTNRENVEVEDEKNKQEIPLEDRQRGINPTCKKKMISSEEFVKHNKCSLKDVENNDAWIAINGYVYNITEWVEFHPGGEVICAVVEKDGSELFNDVHGKDKKIIENYLPAFCIGKLEDNDNLKAN